jgi:acetyl esterase/lipase
MKIRILAILALSWPSVFPAIVFAQNHPDVAIQKDIVYGHAGGVDLKLDIGQPEGDGPFPVIVLFHGGGWQQGDKSHMHRWIWKLVAAGYVGVSVGYRFAPDFKWPSQVEDAKAAVRYLRANAGEWKIDPKQIGAMGESAGGYLALMLGVTSSADEFEGDKHDLKAGSVVQAVVCYFSATEFTLARQELSPELQAEMLRYYNKPLDQVLVDFTGASGPDDPILKKISVLSYVDKRDAPTLMFHGDSDPFVSLEQPNRLVQAFDRAKVPNELVVVKGGGHGWTGAMEEETTQKMLLFFEKWLKKK